jgi:hypothetical protein
VTDPLALVGFYQENNDTVILKSKIRGFRLNQLQFDRSRIVSKNRARTRYYTAIV